MAGPICPRVLPTDSPRNINRLNPERMTLRFNRVKLSAVKDKKKILKVTKEKMTYHIQGKPHKTRGGFLNRNLTISEGTG